jgi:site-specific DNA-methyltransferase (adenine-specific)
MLYHGDCLDILPTIPDKTIDFILTDIPYGTTGCKWDNIIPFDVMWKDLKRIIKDNGCIALFGSEPFSSYLRTSNIKWFKYDWIWQKEQGTDFQLCKYKPLKNYELISIFGKKITYKPQGLIKINKFKKAKTDNLGHLSNISKRDHIQIFKNYPTQIIRFNNQRGLHPTQKPVALLKYLIKTYTNENHTVLDFTMGSGSTGVACQNIIRNFIGIEKDKSYFNIAKERIESLN